MSCHFLFTRKRGFSFMELIVVIAIIMIMTVVMLVMSMRDRDNKKLEAVGREVTAAIRETQNNALTGKQFQNNELPCAMMFTTDGNNYSVKSSSRTLDTNCPADTNFAAYVYEFMSGDLSGRNVKMAVWNYTSASDAEKKNPAHIVFTVPYGKYIDDIPLGGALNSPSKGAEIRIMGLGEEDVDRPSSHYRICVHPTGLIEDMGIVQQGDDDPAKQCLFVTATTP